MLASVILKHATDSANLVIIAEWIRHAGFIFPNFIIVSSFFLLEVPCPMLVQRVAPGDETKLKIALLVT